MGKKKTKKFNFRLKHILLLMVSISIITTIINQQSTMRDLKRQKEVKQQEVAELKDEISKLNKEIKASDSIEFIEKIAREELHMVKPGEKIYIDKNKEKDKNPFSRKRKP